MAKSKGPCLVCYVSPSGPIKCRWCGRGWCIDHITEMLFGFGHFNVACRECADKHVVSVTEFLDARKYLQRIRK